MVGLIRNCVKPSDRGSDNRGTPMIQDLGWIIKDPTRMAAPSVLGPCSIIAYIMYDNMMVVCRMANPFLRMERA